MLRDYIGCGLPILAGHLGVAYFIGSITALTKGNEVGMMVGIGYVLLFPFIVWLAWGLGGPIKSSRSDWRR